MKKILLPAVALFMLVAAACTKTKECCVIPENDFYIRAQKNGHGWTLPSHFYSFGDSVTITGNSATESFSVRLKFMGKGYYVPTTARYFTLVGGDVVSAEYYDKAGWNNYLEVKSYNEETKIATGTFRFMLVKNSRYTSVATDSMNFTQGTFRVKMEQQPCAFCN